VDAPVVRIVRGDETEAGSKPSVIVGTLAAAHGFCRYGAICVADLDQLLRRPDFRASEYALHTLHELAGVLSNGGRFLVQTREPEHHVVQSFTRGSYRYFLERELPYRRETGYPPYGVVVRVDLDADLVEDLRRQLRGVDAHIIGALARRGRSSALVRAPALEPLLDPLRRFVGEHVRTRIDVDPVDVA
jgi:primosomal protein N' (replication factor Y)